jgi:hypothetical protein
MRFRMYQRRDHRDGMLVLVPMTLQAPSAEAQKKHGPLEAVGAIDADHEAGIDWRSVKCELDIYGYATLPGNALSRQSAARTATAHRSQ